MGMLKGFGPGTEKYKPKKKRGLTKAQKETKQAGSDLLDKWNNVPKLASGIYGQKVPKKATKVERRAIPSSLVQERLADFRAIPSLKSTKNATTKKSKVVYTDDDLAKRDAKARERVFTVAPAYNKGADQLIYNPEDYKTMGRKV